MNNYKLLKVAFQGERGAYSEMAVYKHFSSYAQAVPCKSFSEVFEKVEEGRVECGVVPVENTIEGSVNQVYDLFLDYDLKVSGEIILKIQHCLVANLNADLTSIRVVYSHPQALAQCSKFLENLECDIIPVYDTAGGAKMVKELGSNDAAAIASERAAEIYEMKILAMDVSNTQDNYTRFLVISKEDSPPSGFDKTSIIFSLKHVPGSLYKALEEFALREINLTKIESRPTRQRPWEYNFYLDFEGHRNDKKCGEALLSLGKKASFLKILGSYPKARL
ncbi:MAG: prephenate dehydratase [Candidatus Bathyarchaeia archaeon]